MEVPHALLNQVRWELFREVQERSLRSALLVAEAMASG
jgi:hypothetical protein